MTTWDELVAKILNEPLEDFLEFPMDTYETIAVEQKVVYRELDGEFYISRVLARAILRRMHDCQIDLTYVTSGIVSVFALEKDGLEPYIRPAVKAWTRKRIDSSSISSIVRIFEKWLLDSLRREGSQNRLPL